MPAKDIYHNEVKNALIDDVVYDKFFQRQSVQAVIQENHLLLIVVNTKKEEIQKWIN